MKNKPIKELYYPLVNLIFRAMRITLLLFIFGLSLHAVESSSQSLKVTLSEENSKTVNIIREIEKQTGYLFVYSDQIEVNKEKSIVVENKPVSQVLDFLFEGTDIGHTTERSHIILFKKDAQEKAQQSTFQIKGIVVEEARREPLIGVSVVVKGTTTGALTDVDGKFELKVSQGDILVVSYLGYTSKEVQIQDRQELEIVLFEKEVALGTVVVTAMGIKREEKSLTYNVQEIKNEALTTVKDASFITSLQGKIAGVTINQSANGIGGSSRVIMRGLKSLSGSSDALYVIDGIPMSNMKSTQPEGSWEIPDGGDSDGISNFNPEDIESMSVLSGASAAALYGSDGANGVILITTKKGKEGKLRVSYSNDTQFLEPFIMPEFQNTYARKNDGVYESWGNKLAEASTYKPKDFFQTGYAETNSLSVNMGTSRNQTYFSASSLNSRGIVPNNKYNRYNFSLRNTTELIADKLTLDMSASYILQNNQNMVAQGQAHNPLVPLYLFPPGDDIEKYKSYEHYNPERNFNTQFWTPGNQSLGMQNPWWIVNREFFNNKKQRYMFSTNLSWKVNDWIRATGRLRVDNLEDTYTRKISASSDKLFASEFGNYLKMRTQYKNFYADAIVSIDKKFGDYGLNVNVGTSVVDNVNEDITGFEGHLLTIANRFVANNIDMSDAESRMLENHGDHFNKQAVFAALQLSYKSMLFLDVTARNEWSSKLAFTSNEKSGYFYPSVGLSYVPSEMFDLRNTPISFLKVRTSYSEVGNDPDKLYITNPIREIGDGGNIALAGFFQPNFKPERTKSFEVGLDLRLLQNKINLSFTYYNANSYNQYLPIEAAPSTGYKYFYVNSGEVNNWGIETTLGYDDKFGNVGWNSTLTFSINRNEIKKLISPGTVNPITGEQLDLEYMDMVTMGSYKQRIEKGGSIGDIYVQGLKTDHHGNVYVNPQDGSVQADNEKWIKAGNAAPKANWGWNNSFSYKGFSLGFLIDARIGGITTSSTQALMDRFGTSKASAEARDNGGAIVNGGKVDVEKYYSVVGGGTTGLLAYYTYSATNIRLREASLGYTFPSKWIKGAIQNLHVSLIAKNLFMFYNKSPYDPELASSTGTYYQGIDYFMQPSLRNIGFSVKLQF